MPVHEQAEHRRFPFRKAEARGRLGDRRLPLRFSCRLFLLSFIVPLQSEGKVFLQGIQQEYIVEGEVLLPFAPVESRRSQTCSSVRQHQLKRVVPAVRFIDPAEVFRLHPVLVRHDVRVAVDHSLAAVDQRPAIVHLVVFRGQIFLTVVVNGVCQKVRIMSGPGAFVRCSSHLPRCRCFLPGGSRS